MGQNSRWTTIAPSTFGLPVTRSPEPADDDPCNRPLPDHDYPTRSPFSAALGLVVAAGVVAGCVFNVKVQAQVRPPGPESFAVAPKTPLELWNAVDYLVRSGQARLAVPYLNAFLKSNPDDATLLRIRDDYGLGSILRLHDDPATAALAEPVLKMVGAAAVRHATDPERLNRAIAALTKSAAEQDYGVDRLRQAGPYAIPPLVRTLSEPSLSDADRALIVRNMGKLDVSALPALVAALDAPNGELAADAAEVLGQIGDARAVPALTFPAARQDGSAALQVAARQAIARITGRPFEAQPRTPIRLLADQAWAYQRHQVAFPADAVELWTWQGDAPAPVTLSRADAEAQLGLRRAREALALNPSNVSAQVATVSLALESAAKQYGAPNVAAQDPTGAFAVSLAAGPAVLGEVVRNAIADDHPDLAAVASIALARVIDRNALGLSNPLLEALSAADRRVQLAAAASLVDLDPHHSFPGASRVVPVLARFATMGGMPRAVVIDGNLNRAGSLVASLQAIGYDPITAADGKEGFRLAAHSADVEFVVLDPTALQGAWGWLDTIANLRADARTAGLPIFLVVPSQPNAGMSAARSLGPLTPEIAERIVTTHRTINRAAVALDDYPRTATLVATEDAAALRTMLDRELNRMNHRAFSPQERQGYARAAAALLAQVAAKPGSPFAADLPAAEPALAAALNDPGVAPAASTALGEVPGTDAQRSLADVLLDPSRPTQLRLVAGGQLVRSIQRFGPLLANDQERRLLDVASSESDPSIHSVLSAVLGALRPEPEAVGHRLRNFAPIQPPAPAPEGGEPAPSQG